MEIQQIILIAISLNVMMSIAMIAGPGTTEDVMVNQLKASFGNYFTIGDADNGTNTAQAQMDIMKGSSIEPSGRDAVLAKTEATGGVSLIESLVQIGSFLSLLFTMIIGSILRFPYIISMTGALPVMLQIIMYPIVMVWVFINFMVVLKFFQVVLKGGR